uniref:Pro-opiomelanocortin/corticotropin ACTH central region domain-containing protein n=1 Tax=Mola mola TaxID=94237 RepID=A0A3Q4BL72_MOLML
MVCLCWLSVVVMACVCVTSFGTVCWDSSICSNLSNRGRILDCIRHCKSVIQTEFPNLSGLALKFNDDDDLLLSVLLAILHPESKISVTDPKVNGNQRRSYSMEHFRWGKPSGRKRRPVKIFTSSLEGGSSSEGSFALSARRQRSSNEDEAKGDLNRENQNQGLLRTRAGSKSHVQLSQQERKNGTYRMNHFRWGSPNVSKRNGSFMKTWRRRPLRQLAKLFRNVIVQRIHR